MDFDTYAHRNLNDPGKVNSTSNTVSRLSGEAENNFAVEFPCILKRISLTVSIGESLVTLPDDVVSIRRVSWKGYKLDPLPQRNFREVFQNATQVGRPFWYVFNNVGQNLIQLFPAANEALPVGAGANLFDSNTGLFDSAGGLFDTFTGANVGTNLYSSNIPNCCIVEYFQAPDFVSAVIPSYIRKRLLKSFVLRGCFNIEGQGQNRKASAYFKDRWRMLKEMYGGLLDELHNKPRKLIVNGITSSYFFPGNPILPIDKFGTSVDAGE